MAADSIAKLTLRDDPTGFVLTVFHPPPPPPGKGEGEELCSSLKEKSVHLPYGHGLFDRHNYDGLRTWRWGPE